MRTPTAAAKVALGVGNAANRSTKTVAPAQFSVDPSRDEGSDARNLGAAVDGSKPATTESILKV